MEGPYFPWVSTSVPYSGCASALKTRSDKYSFIKQNERLKSCMDLLELQLSTFLMQVVEAVSAQMKNVSFGSNWIYQYYYNVDI